MQLSSTRLILDDRPVWRLDECLRAYGTRVVREAMRACLHGVLLLSTLCYGATRATYPAPIVGIRVTLFEEDGPGLYDNNLDGGVLGALLAELWSV